MIVNSKEYAIVLANIKIQIQEAQLKAALTVNQELIRLYWSIGSSVLENQINNGWGSKVVERLAQDLKSAFPDMKGFSLTNVKYMSQFAKEYPDFSISQTVLGQITWSHNTLLDNPSIGLILCKSKSKLQVEIALQDIKKPVGVSDYFVDLGKNISKEFVSSLPTIEEIERELIDHESLN